METIHQRLKKYREIHKLTIQEVSNKTGIPASTYKEWENGRKIQGEPYEALSNLYRVSIQELITGKKGTTENLQQRLDAAIESIREVQKDLLALS